MRADTIITASTIIITISTRATGELLVRALKPWVFRVVLIALPAS
jgi:hypothetical protein